MFHLKQKKHPLHTLSSTIGCGIKKVFLALKVYLSRKSQTHKAIGDIISEVNEKQWYDHNGEFKKRFLCLKKH